VSAPLNDAELRRRIASLIVVRASGHASDRQRRYPRWELPNQALRRLLADGVGGVILLGGTATELHQRCRTCSAGRISAAAVRRCGRGRRPTL